MTLNEYQSAAQQFAIYPRSELPIYPALGLTGEAGEVSEAIKKAIRDDGGTLTAERKEKLLLEVGDVLWYVAAMANDLGFTLSEVAQKNIEKLSSRQTRGVLTGSGDFR